MPSVSMNSTPSTFSAFQSFTCTRGCFALSSSLFLSPCLSPCIEFIPVLGEGVGLSMSHDIDLTPVRPLHIPSNAVCLVWSTTTWRLSITVQQPSLTFKCTANFRDRPWDYEALHAGQNRDKCCEGKSRIVRHSKTFFAL